MTDKHVDLAIAEMLDAHLLSYLTRQECRTIEFEPFWISRLVHYRTEVRNDTPAEYVVHPTEVDRSWDWINGGWPGESPPETLRFLWPRLQHTILSDPSLLVERESLADGYERIRLRRPLPEQGIGPTTSSR